MKKKIEIYHFQRACWLDDKGFWLAVSHHMWWQQCMIWGGVFCPLSHRTHAKNDCQYNLWMNSAILLTEHLLFLRCENLKKKSSNWQYFRYLHLCLMFIYVQVIKVNLSLSPTESHYYISYFNQTLYVRSLVLVLLSKLLAHIHLTAILLKMALK